jgi:YbbR domain-containing protein
MSWGSIVVNNFWAKIISLALAVATWFYVFDMVNTDSFMQKKTTVEDLLSRHEFTIKEVPVKPVFYGTSPSGYRVLFEKVKIEPSRISVFGPEEILEGVNELKTDKIDLNEYTRSVQLRLGISSEVRALKFEDKTVDVFLPVEPLQKDKP